MMELSFGSKGERCPDGEAREWEMGRKAGLLVELIRWHWAEPACRALSVWCELLSPPHVP